MIRSPTLAQQWPVATDRVQISAAVVRSHLLANPQGMTISEIVDRAGLTKYIGDQRACVSTYLAAVWRILADMEESGIAVEIGERWFDAIQVQRASEAKQRRAKFTLDFIA